MHQIMNLSRERLAVIFNAIKSMRVLVVGDIILDHYLWGNVSRISPEAPVPVLDFNKESYMPGGAANVARNITAFGACCAIYSVTGKDSALGKVKQLLLYGGVDTQGISTHKTRHTSIKTRIIANQQQIVRVDRETRVELEASVTIRLVDKINDAMEEADAVIIEDYGKGVISQYLIDELTSSGNQLGKWVSMDPKPVHRLDIKNTSLITPNRKEAFELVGRSDTGAKCDPLKDTALLDVAALLLARIHSRYLLITLGNQGMLLCEKQGEPIHIPTIAKEVYDVSGAGDTVIAAFTLAVVAGASPIEAVILANHAAGVVVGKIGASTATEREIIDSFQKQRSITVDIGCTLETECV